HENGRQDWADHDWPDHVWRVIGRTVAHGSAPSFQERSVKRRPSEVLQSNRELLRTIAMLHRTETVRVLVRLRAAKTLRRAIWTCWWTHCRAPRCWTWEQYKSS